jgi:hypothetical protein
VGFCVDRVRGGANELKRRGVSAREIDHRLRRW